MKKLLLGAVLALASTSAFAETCKVTDPTGTPLNVRATPNGKIVSKIKNGTTVSIDDYAFDKKGRPWVYIFDKTGERGWVYREFVSCY